MVDELASTAVILHDLSAVGEDMGNISGKSWCLFLTRM